jgi:hypothetical protein
VSGFLSSSILSAVVVRDTLCVEDVFLIKDWSLIGGILHGEEGLLDMAFQTTAAVIDPVVETRLHPSEFVDDALGIHGIGVWFGEQKIDEFEQISNVSNSTK